MISTIALLLWIACSAAATRRGKKLNPSVTDLRFASLYATIALLSLSAIPVAVLTGMRP